MKKEEGYTLIELLAVTFCIALVIGLGGWIANIVKLVGMNFDHVTGMLVARAIGVIAVPIGAVLGFI